MTHPFETISGKAIARAAAGRHSRSGGWLDMRFGFALFRDRHVPGGRKLLALALGVGITSLIVALELPVETIVAGLLNLLGLGLDAMLDGLELVVGPALFAALFLPRILPEELRAARRAAYISGDKD